MSFSHMRGLAAHLEVDMLEELRQKIVGVDNCINILLGLAWYSK